MNLQSMAFGKNLSKIQAQVSELWEPQKELLVSEWAEENYIISSGAEIGKWKNRPYQIEMMDAYCDPKVEFVTVKKSARVGGTKVLNCVSGYAMHYLRCPVLSVLPTVDDAKGHSKDEIQPMIDDVECLSKIVSVKKSRDSNNTILKKMYPGGPLTLVGANSGSGFRRLTVRFAIGDEIDAYPLSAGDDGDQLELMIMRTDTYYNRKIGFNSTPLIAGSSKIAKSFLQSDQRYYNVPCPKCDTFQPLSWKNFYFGKNGIGSINNPVFLCVNSKCNHEITHDKKIDIIEAGKWIATAPFTNHAGFHIWAAYSYNPNSTWKDIAKNFNKVKNIPEKHQTFVNLVRGWEWEEDVSQLVDYSSLQKRSEKLDGYDMPEWVSTIVIGADTQDDRIEFEVIGYGEGETSFGISYKRIFGDLTTTIFWDKLLNLMLNKKYKREDGVLLDVSLVCIDSGGHFTDEVYKFSKRKPYKIIPIKGASVAGKPIITVPKKKNRSGVKLAMIGTDTAKDVVYGRYKINDPDSMGYCSWIKSNEYDTDYFRMLTAAKKVRKYRGGKPYHVWETPKSQSDEASDCRVYGLAAIRYLQQYAGLDLSKINDDSVDFSDVAI